MAERASTAGPDRPTWRARLHPLLDGEGRTAGSAVVRAVILAAIVVNAATVILSTVAPLAAAWGELFTRIDDVSLAIFALDYVARIWTAPEEEAMAGRGPWSARIAYLRSPLGLIDLVALLPLCAQPFVPAGSEWFGVVRSAAVLKITRHAPALRLFGTVIRNESRVLLSALLAMTVNWILASAIIFALEHRVQPDVFSSMPQAMWWAIVTMATVGYGDIVPVSAGGRIFGGLVMVLGIASVAVPAGILASGFSDELRKRRSMVSWRLVARLPLFAGLEASRIAAIAQLLRRDVIPPHHTIVRRGEPGDAMFFIASGEVDVEIEPQPLRLGRGQYFGEIALLRQVPRTATVVSVTECELLVLAAADFHRLLLDYPSVQKSIDAVAQHRIPQKPPDPPAA